MGWKRVRDEDLRDAEKYATLAEKNWGQGIRTQNGWASPLVPHIRPRDIRFSHLERIVEGELLRPDYIFLNNSIHAGPTSVVRQADFTKGHVMVTRPIANYEDFATTSGITLWLLRMITDVAGKSITLLTENDDDYLNVGELFRRTDEALKLLEAKDPLAFR